MLQLQCYYRGWKKSILILGGKEMKLTKTITDEFKKGESYRIEDTVGYPPEYFRKPNCIKEDPSRKYTRYEEGSIDELSDYDVCVKSFKVITKWYE